MFNLSFLERLKLLFNREEDKNLYQKMIEHRQKLYQFIIKECKGKEAFVNLFEEGTHEYHSMYFIRILQRENIEESIIFAKMPPINSDLNSIVEILFKEIRDVQIEISEIKV